MLNEELTVNAGLLCGQLLLPFTTCLAMLDATADAADDMLSEYLFTNECFAYAIPGIMRKKKDLKNLSVV
jgi:hypothetical protein